MVGHLDDLCFLFVRIPLPVISSICPCRIPFPVTSRNAKSHCTSPLSVVYVRHAFRHRPNPPSFGVRESGIDHCLVTCGCTASPRLMEVYESTCSAHYSIISHQPNKLTPSTPGPFSLQASSFNPLHRLSSRMSSRLIRYFQVLCCMGTPDGSSSRPLGSRSGIHQCHGAPSIGEAERVDCPQYPVFRVVECPHSSQPSRRKAEDRLTPVPPVMIANCSPSHDAPSRGDNERIDCLQLPVFRTFPSPFSLRTPLRLTPYVQVIFCLVTHDS